MEFFKSVVQFLTGIAILISIVNLYFKANKIWKRKHEKEVAESQSIVALGSEALLYILWGVSFALSRDWGALADNAVGMVETGFFIIIGSGMFVIQKKHSKKSFWQMIKDSIHMERKEAAYLLKSLSGKGQAEKIIKILKNIAWIDNDLADKEKEMILNFASSWNVKLSEAELLSKPKSDDGNEISPFKLLKKSLEDYLNEEPQASQVKEVKKLIHDMIDADGRISREEDIIIGELDGLICEYLNEPNPKYHVIVIPQQQEHREIVEMIVKTLDPHKEISKLETKIDGGFGFIMEECFSVHYADILAQEQRENHSIMTIVKQIV